MTPERLKELEELFRDPEKVNDYHCEDLADMGSELVARVLELEALDTARKKELEVVHGQLNTVLGKLSVERDIRVGYERQGMDLMLANIASERKVSEERRLMMKASYDDYKAGYIHGSNDGGYIGKWLSDDWARLIAEVVPTP